MILPGQIPLAIFERSKYDDGTYPPGFWAWLERNEHIYAAFVRRAFRAKRAGLRHYSARAIVEVIRWQTSLAQRDAEPFKLNNNWTPGLARLAMVEFPQLDGFFRTRGDGETEDGHRC